MAGGSERLRWAEAGAYVVAVAGLIALVSIAVAPGTLYLLALAAMVLALAPVMLGFYELGGRTPLAPARPSLSPPSGRLSSLPKSTISRALSLPHSHRKAATFTPQRLAAYQARARTN